MRYIVFFYILLQWLLFQNVSFSQEYYYYQGRMINLQPRNDKIAIIVNHSALNKASLWLELSALKSLSDSIVFDKDNVYHINLSSRGNYAEIDNYILRLSSKTEIIKFATRVYYGESKNVTQIPTDEFIVRLKHLKDLPLLEFLNIRNNCYITGQIGDEKGFVIKSNDGVTLNALQLSDLYYRTGIFEYAEPNFLYPEFCLLHFTPNDIYYPQQWALNNTGQSVSTGGSASYGDLTSVNGIPNADMNVNLAWDFVTGSTVKVGIVDTGIDSTHPDLISNIYHAGYDGIWNKYLVPRDSGSHGTACAGIIAALYNNSIGVAGIAPNAKIMSLRFLSSSGSGNITNATRCIDTARVLGIDIISNSWGGGTPSSTFDNAINNAALNGRGGKGCIILFSSGNDGKNPPNYPGYLANVICVGASTPHDQKKSAGTGNQFWWGGNYGDQSGYGDLEVVAPTVCYTTDRQGASGYSSSDYYPTFNGTSCACPNAAGVTALILSVNTSLTRLQVWEYLLRGCDKIDNYPYSTSKTYGKWNEYFGYGRVNAYNSVRLAAGVDVTPPTINHRNIASHSSTYPTQIIAEITDQDGSSVPSAGNNQPKIFFRLNKNNSGWSSFDSITAISSVGNNFYFYIPCQGYETEVQYYIRSRDNSGNETTFPRGAPNDFWLCYFAIGSFTTNTNKLSAWSPPDYNYGISGNVNFGSFKIINSKVTIYLRHTWVSDNILQIWAPFTDNNNTRKALFSKNGGSGDNLSGTIISDSATQFWWQGSPPYAGTFKPEYMLIGYNGNNASGNWKFINRDVASGDAPTYDSIRITLLSTNGTTSSSARFENQGDSVIDFGYVSYGSYVDRNYYLKNTGTANLTVSSVNFTGTYASMFSLINSTPAFITQNDSGLFTIRCTHQTTGDGTTISHTDITSVQSGIMNISINDPSKPILNISLLTDNPLPVAISDFSAATSNNDVRLTWVTEHEINNSGFELQRCVLNTNENRNELLWIPLTFIQGHGTTSEPQVYNYHDFKLNIGKYKYRLKQIDYNGYFEYYELYNPREVVIGSPAHFEITQNYPNPSNPSSKIDYVLPSRCKVNITIFDITGREINTLVNTTQDEGYYTTEFDGSQLASGIYFYRITAENTGQKFIKTMKLVLVK